MVGKGEEGEGAVANFGQTNFGQTKWGQTRRAKTKFGQTTSDQTSFARLACALAVPRIVAFQPPAADKGPDPGRPVLRD